EMKLGTDGKQHQPGDQQSSGKGESLSQTALPPKEHFAQMPLPGKEVRRPQQERGEPSHVVLADSRPLRQQQEERAPLSELRLFSPEPVRTPEGTLANRP